MTTALSRALSDEIDKIDKERRVSKGKARVVADPMVSASQIEDCLKVVIRQLDDTDLWSLLVPPSGGPRVWTFKQRPNGQWMAKTADIIYVFQIRFIYSVF